MRLAEVGYRGDYLMEFMEVIRRRRSIRKYKRDSISEEKLTNILEAGRLAPSGGNRQPWRFIVVEKKTTRERVAEAANNQTWIGEAPVVIVGCYASISGVPSVKCVRDTAIAFEHIVLAAINEGLATCWVGAFDERKIKDILKIPSETSVLAIAPMGYSAGEPRPFSRKRLEEIVSYDEYKLTS